MRPDQPSAAPINPTPATPQMFQPSVAASAYQPQPVTAQPTVSPLIGSVPPAVPSNTVAQPVPQVTSSPKKRSKLPFVIAGAVLIILALTAAAIFLTTTKTTPTPVSNEQAVTTSSGPSGATSAGMQQNYDAVSQSLSTLDDNRDFPAGALDDTALAKN